MSDRSKKKLVLFLACLGIAAIAMLIASFSPRATQVAAQVKQAGVSEAALQAAIQRALPGVVATHGGGGVGGTQGQSMGSVAPARPVNMSDVPQKWI